MGRRNCRGGTTTADMSNPKTNPFNIAKNYNHSKKSKNNAAAFSKKIKATKSSKSSKSSKHKISTKSKNDGSNGSDKKKGKLKKKKTKKFDYKLPIIDGLPDSALSLRQMPWYRAEHQTRFANRRKCSDDWSHYGSDHDEDGDDDYKESMQILEKVVSNTKDKENKKKLQKYKVHPFSKPALAILDEEIHSFCAYVRLTRVEIQARQNLQDQVVNACKALFQIHPMKEITVSQFGSFASLDVCTFASDIDLALWNILEQDPSYQPENKQQIKEQSNVKKRKLTAALKEEEQKQLSQKQLQLERRNKKVQKWMDILQEAEEKKECEREDDDKATNDDKKKMKEPAEICNSISEEELFTIDKTPDFSILEEVTDSDQPNKLNESENQTGQVNQPIVIDDENSEEKNVESDDSDSIEVIECNFNDADNQSDEDNVDKLESLKEPQKDSSPKINKILPPPSPSASDIWPTSGSDSDSCSSVEENLRNEDDNIEVSFFSNHRSLPSSPKFSDDSDGDDESSGESDSSPPSKSASQITVMGPTGKTRELIVRTLTRLGRKLYKTGVVYRLDVRKKARVPIINIITTMGFETDVAIGGHNGMDTSEFASSWIKRHKAFAPVVVLLKILLRQTDLDKPFTGGLGSYKLYVLVACHLTKHLALGGSDSPGDMFLSFLFRFGKVQTAYDGPYSKIMTELSQDLIVYSEHNGIADLSSVFKLEHIVKVLGMFYMRLMSQYAKHKKSDKLSFLASIIDKKTLHQDREYFYDKARRPYHSSKKRSITIKKPVVSKKPAANQQPKNISTPNSKKKPKIFSITGKRQKSATELEDEKEEAAKLMASYGLKEGFGGALISINESGSPTVKTIINKRMNKKKKKAKKD